MKKNRRFYKMDEKGFTLMEIMVATAIGLFLGTVMYKVVTANSESITLQMRKAEIQQNLRASIFVLETEIKRIGFNPMNLQTVHAPGITHADKASLSFQADLNGNGRSFSVDDDYGTVVAYSGGNITLLTDPREVTTINLGSNDADGNGIADSSTASLIRGNPGSLTIANNIEALNFVYLDRDGNVVNGTSAAMVYPVNAALLSNIKKIQVTLVVRSSTTRQDYTNSHNYVNAQDQEILPAKDDGYDRTLLSKTIDCRNLGLL